MGDPYRHGEQGGGWVAVGAARKGRPYLSRLGYTGKRAEPKSNSLGWGA